MRHPENAVGKSRICPITKKPFRVTCSDHSLPGVFNYCDSCRPNTPSLGAMLHALQARRKADLTLRAQGHDASMMHSGCLTCGE
jgi:hypothetical protein